MERELTLKRTDTGREGTFGEIWIDGEPFCFTAELPWRGNKPFVSCIPTGTYVFSRHQSPKFGDCCQVVKVEGRSSILLHRGNFAGREPLKSDVQGCVVVGERIGRIAGQKAVISSSSAFARLMKRLWDDGDEDWTIRIEGPHAEPSQPRT